MTDFWTIVGGISAALAGIAIVAGAVKNSKWFLMRVQTRINLSRMGLDWAGEEARPGFEGRPSVPERLSLNDKMIAGVNHYVRGELTSHISLMAMDVDTIKAQSGETSSAVHHLDVRIDGLEARVTDELRRGEERAAALRQDMREDLEKRARIIEKALAERNEVIDSRLSTISTDLLRGETYRASLVELGIPVDERDP